MKHTPYNTGKVKIGVHYAPPPRREFTREELRWQRALTEPPVHWTHKAKLLVYVAFVTFTIVSLAMMD
jgi:hypothetical protein